MVKHLRDYICFSFIIIALIKIQKNSSFKHLKALFKTQLSLLQKYSLPPLSEEESES